MSGTKFSKFLRFFSGLEYTHVSISLREDLSVMYSFGRQSMKRPWIAGFTVENPDEGVFGKYDSKCQVMCFEVSDEVYQSIQKKIEKVRKNSKAYKYNFVGLVFSYLHMERKLETRFTCTQFVAWILREAGVECWEKDVSLVYPDDYHLIPDIEMTYEGLLSQYSC